MLPREQREIPRELLEARRSPDEIELGERWYQALRHPRYKHLETTVPRWPWPRSSGGPPVPPQYAARHELAMEIRRLQRREEELRAQIKRARAGGDEHTAQWLERQLPNWAAIARGHGVSVDDLERIAEGDYIGGSIIGEWARSGRVDLGPHLILPPPAEPIRSGVLLQLLRNEAPAWAGQRLEAILHNSERSGGHFAASLLRPGSLYLNSPVARNKVSLEACLWLAGRLTKEDRHG